MNQISLCIQTKESVTSSFHIKISIVQTATNHGPTHAATTFADTNRAKHPNRQTPPSILSRLWGFKAGLYKPTSYKNEEKSNPIVYDKGTY